MEAPRHPARGVCPPNRSISSRGREAPRL